MKCPQVVEHLEDYLDGELTAASRQSVDEHLTGCPDCRRLLQARRSLLAEARRLAVEAQPARDLWPAIAARIEPDQPRRSSWWLQLAAAGIALAVLSIPLSVWWSTRGTESTSTPVDALINVESEAIQASLARSEDGVQLARTDLVTTIERHRDVIADETLQQWVDSMTLLDKAIGELRTALDEDPYNRRLRMLLASRYQQERRLLQKFSRV